MVFDAFLNHIYVKRAIAAGIDLGIELLSGALGGYFGAMVAALVIVLHDVKPATTQKAIWMGMGFGFLFWMIAVSWVNRVLIQGMSRASIGKRLMSLEIISNGPLISWSVMMRNWVTGSLIGEVRVVSSVEHQDATVIPIQTAFASQEKPAASTDEKKAA